MTRTTNSKIGGEIVAFLILSAFVWGFLILYVRGL